jgi:uncharacterized protein (TIGR02186 family)
MKIKLIIIFLLISCVGYAKPIDTDISHNQILIDARFSGQKLFLFGARNSPGEIIVVVRGPNQNFVVRKKEKIAGVWLNRKQMRFHDIYGFYDIYSSYDISKISNELLVKNLSLGIDNLPLNYSGEAYLEEIDDFRGAILDKKLEKNLYKQNINEIQFMGDTLFKANLSFPKTIPHGIYNIDIYLIADDNFAAMQTIPIEVKRTGFESFVYNSAHKYSMFYAIFCVLAALFAGWLANVIFWKV